MEHSLYNYIAVVGGEEQKNKSVNVRKRKEGEEAQKGRDGGGVPLDAFIEDLRDQVKKHL